MLGLHASKVLFRTKMAGLSSKKAVSKAASSIRSMCWLGPTLVDQSPVPAHHLPALRVRAIGTLPGRRRVSDVVPWKR